MSVVFSGTNQGSFTSNGSAKLLNIRSDLDYMWVYNLTQGAASQTTAVGVKYYWQRGFPAGSMWVTFKSNAANAANLEQYITTGGFTLIDTSISVPGAQIAITSITNATPPVVATGSTAGLSNGDIVRIFNVAGAQQLGGFDFTIGAVVANTSFTLAFMRAIVAGTTGFWRRIPYDPYFYPPVRVISKINRADSSTFAYSASGSFAIVTLTVTHAFTVGQKIRFKIPVVTALAFGMPALNDVEATIVAINKADIDSVTNTITVDVDISALGTFAWPLTADVPFTPAQVVPVGENTAQANASLVNPFADAELNTAFIGIKLDGGAGFPGGAAEDVMYWVAGKSFNM